MKQVTKDLQRSKWLNQHNQTGMQGTRFPSRGSPGTGRSVAEFQSCCMAWRTRRSRVCADSNTQSLHVWPFIWNVFHIPLILPLLHSLTSLPVWRALCLAPKYKDEQATSSDLKKPTILHNLSRDPWLDTNFLRTGLQVLYSQVAYSFISQTF